ncbi:MAG: hypothetical protein K5770_13200 [Lachnospiraceae bacterium]|nr:hypothetical protein [Lachnospiraceae bacterium]
MRKTGMMITSLVCAIFIGLIFMGNRTEAASRHKPKTGGWTLFTDNSPCMMSEKDSIRISEALKDHGGHFEVLGLVAAQVVSGTNYMYLAYGTEANEAIPGYYFIKLYSDTKGHNSIVSVASIDVTKIQTGKPLGKAATGAWAVRTSGKPGMFPDQNVQASFDAINNGDVIYNPVALLAAQPVSGTNYKALCTGNDKKLYVVTWYVDLQGNASLTSSECVNIGAYSR